MFKTVKDISNKLNENVNVFRKFEMKFSPPFILFSAQACASEVKSGRMPSGSDDFLMAFV
jgi:hypothetical protein